MRIKERAILILAGVVLAGVPLVIISSLAHTESEIVVSAKTETVTNYITNRQTIKAAPEGCEDIAAKYNEIIAERQSYLSTPSRIYASDGYVYASNAWRVERAKIDVRNNPALSVGVGAAYPIGAAVTIQYTPIPIQAGAVIQVDRATFFVQYVVGFGATSDR